MIDETIMLKRLSDYLDTTVLEVEPVGPVLVRVVVWDGDRMVQALVHDPDSALGWAFLSNEDATWRAHGRPR